MYTTRLDPVDGQRARAMAYHDVVARIECCLACPAGSIMERKSAMVLPCHQTKIRGQVRAREISCLSRSSPFHSHTGDARLKDAVFPRGLPSNAGGVVYAVWRREELLYGVNASGCSTPRRGLFDTMYAVY